MNNPTRAILSVALGLSLALAACSAKPAVANISVDVTITDFAYAPKAFTVPAGSQVTLNAKNNGAVEHEFALMKLGTSVTPPFGEKDEGGIFWEMDGIEPNTTKSATFTAPAEPGTYQVICGLAGHIENGMIATLTVTK